MKKNQKQTNQIFQKSSFQAHDLRFPNEISKRNNDLQERSNNDKDADTVNDYQSNIVDDIEEKCEVIEEKCEVCWRKMWSLPHSEY